MLCMYVMYVCLCIFFLRMQSSLSFRKNLVFMVAVDRSNRTLSAAEYVHHAGLGRVVAGTINMASETHFYGRYWGAFSYHNNLHFEVCYYKVCYLTTSSIICECTYICIYVCMYVCSILECMCDRAPDLSQRTSILYVCM